MPRQQKGFSLIEMLVTLLLGAILMLALANTMSAVSRSQGLIDDYERIQETLRFTTSIISRSLRTAEHLTSATNNNQLVVKREGDGERVACNGEKPKDSSDPDNKVIFHEIYSLNGSNLQCVVEAESGNPAWEGAVTLAYGIQSLGFACMPYHANDERDFSTNLPCTIDQGNIVAVQVSITFNTSEFIQLKDSYTHSFVTTLRTRLGHCAAGKDRDDNDRCSP